MLALAASAAVLYMLAFPAWNWWWCGFLCLLPFFEIIRRSPTPLSAFLWSTLASTGAWALTLYWIYVMVAFNTASALQAAICLAALSLYCGLYGGLWGYIVKHASTRVSVPVAGLLAVAAWVATEYLRCHLITGFPWTLLGMSQWNNNVVLQWAEIGGVYLVSGLVALMNVLLYSIFIRRNAAISYLLWCIAVVAALLAGGTFLDRRHNVDLLPAVKVGVIQGNIDQYKKWDKQFEAEIRSAYSRLSGSLSGKKPLFVLWPETAVPGFVPLNDRLMQWLNGVSSATGLWLLVGTPFAENSDHGANAVVVVSPESGLLARHIKTHLVPFGEYVPLRKYLEPFFGILNALGDFDRGTELRPLMVNGTLVGPTICSENLFPEKTAALVRNGAVLLTNHTNDGWFLTTAASQQHFIANIFRAVETRRTVVVSANTGVSGAIVAAGGVVSRIDEHTSTSFVVMVNPARGITWYVRFGDWFAYTCLIASTLAAGYMFIISQRLRRIS